MKKALFTAIVIGVLLFATMVVKQCANHWSDYKTHLVN